MKKTLILSLAFAGFTFAASAQTDRMVKPDSAKMMNRGMRPGGQMKMQNEQMMNDLNLTDAQREQMKKNNEEMRTGMAAIRDNATLTPDEKRAQMKALQEKRKTQMDALLTPEQKAKWEANRKKMMEERRNNPEMKNAAPATLEKTSIEPQ